LASMDLLVMFVTIMFTKYFSTVTVWIDTLDTKFFLTIMFITQTIHVHFFITQNTFEIDLRQSLLITSIIVISTQKFTKYGLCTRTNNTLSEDRFIMTTT